ncbi:MAG: formylmethanofuran dehydrogenase subunit C [Candidatus Thiodiazotropha endolucinida]|nr:formylmethanofuran dehydrogenase subunit C [Candidatus Thiodiazotropha taylori]MCW4311925.1 formylmethanofuran dehydrogenase subunit C [Candidatus Thiodiazotropha taylori]
MPSLKLRAVLNHRLDMSPFTPELVADKSADEIARTPIWLGNRQVDTGELFEIRDNASESLLIQSESDKLDMIGAAMTHGSILVEGNAGAYLGRSMTGGEIRIVGNTGLAAGCAMRAGNLFIEGDAGDFLGGALTGDRQGMRGGRISVQGDCGDRVGDLMRRGTILIGGNAGDFCASRMVAGTIIVLGQCGRHTASGMRRGSLITADKPASLPATFNCNGIHSLSFLTLLRQQITSQTGFSGLSEMANEVERWVGDLSCDGKGEILILQS